MTEQGDPSDWPFDIDYADGTYEVDIKAWPAWLRRISPDLASPAFASLVASGCDHDTLVRLFAEIQLSYHNPKLSREDFDTLRKATQSMGKVFAQDQLLLWRVEMSHLGSMIFDGVGEDFVERLFRLRDNLERADAFVGQRVQGR